MLSNEKIESEIEELQEELNQLQKNQNLIISLGGDDLEIREQIAELEDKINEKRSLLEDK